MVDVTLTDASALGHAVAAALAGRCMQLTWSSAPTEDIAGTISA